MKIVITGASGIVGSHTASELERRGHSVVRLGRPAFVLGAPVDRAMLAGADALVHCAYDFKAFGWDEVKRTNVDGSVALFRAAREAGVKNLIFVSTIAAFDGCKSIYGKGKLEVEREVLALGGAVIRPGLIHGDEQGRGMFGSLAKITRLPAVPVFGGGSQVFFMVHVQDVAAALADMCEQPAKFAKRVVTAAEPTPVTFREILKRLAKMQTGRNLVTVPVPTFFGLAGLKTLEALGLRPGFRSDSLVSMMNSDRNPDFSAARDAGLRFRPW